MELEKEAHVRLNDFYRDSMVHLKAGDFLKSEKYYNHKAICEDTRLSISSIGQSFVGFLLDANKMPTLTAPQLQLWIDILCSFAIFDPLCAEGPKQKTEMKAICEAVSTLAIADRVSNGGDLAHLARSKL